MSNEIKEILDKLKNYDNYKYRIESGRSYKEIEGWEIDLLLDYITNLQEKVKLLTTGLEATDKAYKDYKSRCEKGLDKLYCYGEVFDSKILQEFQKEMINILTGGDTSAKD